MQTWIEREQSLERAPVLAALERWKRMRREGWHLHVLRDLTSGELIALGWRE